MATQSGRWNTLHEMCSEEKRPPAAADAAGRDAYPAGEHNKNPVFLRCQQCVLFAIKCEMSLHTSGDAASHLAAHLFLGFGGAIDRVADCLCLTHLS